MRPTRLSIPDLILLEPKCYQDQRGYFYESYNQKVYEEFLGPGIQFVQDNLSFSIKHVLRGLHFQIKQPQGKLIRLVSGSIYDVAVDIRPNSPSFGQWVGLHLSAESNQQLYIPPGFAHGFLVLSDYAKVMYKTTDYWAPEHERCIKYNDKTLNIDWPLTSAPITSAKDANGMDFSVISSQELCQ